MKRVLAALVVTTVALAGLAKAQDIPPDVGNRLALCMRNSVHANLQDGNATTGEELLRDAIADCHANISETIADCKKGTSDGDPYGYCNQAISKLVGLGVGERAKLEGYTLAPNKNSNGETPIVKAN